MWLKPTKAFFLIWKNGNLYIISGRKYHNILNTSCETECAMAKDSSRVIVIIEKITQ